LYIEFVSFVGFRHARFDVVQVYVSLLGFSFLHLHLDIQSYSVCTIDSDAPVAKRQPSFNPRTNEETMVMGTTSVAMFDNDLYDEMCQLVVSDSMTLSTSEYCSRVHAFIARELHHGVTPCEVASASAINLSSIVDDVLHRTDHPLAINHKASLCRLRGTSKHYEHCMLHTGHVDSPAVYDLVDTMSTHTATLASHQNAQITLAVAEPVTPHVDNNDNNDNNVCVWKFPHPSCTTAFATTATVPTSQMTSFDPQHNAGLRIPQVQGFVIVGVSATCPCEFFTQFNKIATGMHVTGPFADVSVHFVNVSNVSEMESIRVHALYWPTRYTRSLLQNRMDLHNDKGVNVHLPPGPFRTTCTMSKIDERSFVDVVTNDKFVWSD
jgi:hypothetical protein